MLELTSETEDYRIELERRLNPPTLELSESQIKHQKLMLESKENEAKRIKGWEI